MQESGNQNPKTDGPEVPDALEHELAGWPEPLNRLREALSQNEFVLYGQPIVDLGVGEHPTMVEALIRLKEEEAALLPPGDFLPAFEHYRMMVELDRWVVAKVVTHLVHDSRISRVSINVSAQSLEDSGFPNFIAEAALAAALPASSLVFEIDESAILERLTAAARFARAAREIGCRVLIDSFGAHGVSFVPLKSVRVDFVKIDGSIVRNIMRSPVSRTKLNAIARVGKTLGFELIAEGVEDKNLLADLKGYGVRYAQGHGISPALPMNVLLAESNHNGVER